MTNIIHDETVRLYPNDSMMYNEIARLYPSTVSSDLEESVRRDMIDWILNVTTSLSDNDMKEAIKMFWDERLN